MAKPAAAPKRGAPQEDTASAPKKSSKKMILIIVAVILLIAGGVVAYLLLKPAPTSKHGKAENVEAVEQDTHKGAAAKIVDLGKFVGNLMHEDDDRMIQIEVSVKITKPELEEKIKESLKEIQHRVNLVLKGKRPSELASTEGLEKLALQIKAHTEYVLGLRKVAPGFNYEPSSAPVEAGTVRSGVAEVLFTSIVIQIQ